MASLGRPGGNLTGLASQSDELWEKRLGLLKEVVPRLSRVAVIANPSNPGTSRAWRRSAASRRDFAAAQLSGSERNNRARAHARLRREGFRRRRCRLLGWLDAHEREGDRKLRIEATRARSGAAARIRERAGALLSFGTSLPSQRRRAAYYVDRILKGVRPADLPVERPTLFELTVNLKTATALGLTLPPSLVVLADDIVQ